MTIINICAIIITLAIAGGLCEITTKLTEISDALTAINDSLYEIDCNTTKE